MKETIQILLPAHLKQWVKEQAARKGFRMTNAFILEIVRREMELEVCERVDDLLTQRLSEGKPTPMMREDWADIRKKGQELAAHDRVEQMLVNGINSGPSTPVTAATWERIRSRGRTLAKKRRKS